MPRPRRISDEIRAQVVRLIGMGWTLPLIASELHIGVESARRIGLEAGVHSEYKGGRVQFDDTKRKEAKERSEEFQRRHVGSPAIYYGTWEPEDDK